jgi:hypothetical protein
LKKILPAVLFVFYWIRYKLDFYSLISDMRMTIDLRLFLKFLPFVVLPFVAHSALEYEWYRGGKHPFTPEAPDNATYNGQPQSIVKIAKLDGNDIKIHEEYVEEYVDSNGNALPSLPSGVGSYTATVIFPSSTGLGNLIGQTFTIEKATLTVSATAPPPRQYGSQNPDLLPIISGPGYSDSDSTGIHGSPVLTTTATPESDVGTYPISVDVTGMLASNYNIIVSNGNLSVTKAPLTIRADSTNRSYGQADPAFTYTPVGLLNNDDRNEVLLGEPTFYTTATSASKPGSYDLEVSKGTLSATNYALSFESGTIIIDKAFPSFPDGFKSTESIDYIDETGNPGTTNLPLSTPEGLTIKYEIVVGANAGVVQISGSRLTAIKAGDTLLTATIDVGNGAKYHPLAPRTIAVYVDPVEHPGMSGYPTLRDVSLQTDPVGLADLLANPTGIKAKIDGVVFGDGEMVSLTTDPGTGETLLELKDQGSVVLKIVPEDSDNYLPTAVYRGFDILPDDHPGLGGETDDPTDPTDPTDPVVPDPPPPIVESPPLSTGKRVDENDDKNHWRFIKWFGFYYWDEKGDYNTDSEGDYIYHYNLGWLYVPQKYLEETPVWMYSFANVNDVDLAWLYTEDQDYQYPTMVAWFPDTDGKDVGTPIRFSYKYGDGNLVFWNYSTQAEMTYE